MPYVQVNLSQTLSDEQKNAVYDLINGSIPLIPGKTPEVTMINIADGCSMRMGYSPDPTIFIDVRLFRQAPYESKNDFVREVTKSLASMFGVKPGNIYINITEHNNWGSNGALR